MALLALAPESSQAAERRVESGPLDITSITQVRFMHNVVYAVQRKLASLGYDPGGVDGLWGPNTQNALNAYRRDKGLRTQRGLDWGVLESLFGRDYIQWKIDDLSSAVRQPPLTGGPAA